jgi:leucyl-tRNA synthetase
MTEMVSDEPLPSKLESLMHKTIKKVSADIEDMKFNTAIASLMTLINEIYAVGHITKDALIDFIKLLCPFAPHICEEMYEELGGEDVLALSKWPEYDEAKTVDASVEIAVQINGKVKATDQWRFEGF